MSVIRLSTADDPRLASYAAVGDPVRLRSSETFVAEGRLVVRRAIESGYRVQSVLVTDTAFHALGDVWSSLAESTPVYVCPLEAFSAVTGFNIHRGCLALVERPAARRFDEVVGNARTVVVLENVGNPDNVGGVFRNAAAFSADAVLLNPACCDPLYRKSIRTSMGSTLAVPFARLCWPSDLNHLRSLGFTVCALTPGADAGCLELSTPRPGGRVALLAGNEGAGLSDAAIGYADLRLRIPIAPVVDSLNVAVAVAIALHAFQSR